MVPERPRRYTSSNMEDAIERYPTAAARQSLARRLRLPYSDLMHDWEWEVADAARFREFVELYRSGSLSEDEMFSLMEILIQCIENMLEDPPDEFAADPAWRTLRPLLMERPDLHWCSMRYWARVGKAHSADEFAMAPRMRELLAGMDC